MINLLNQLRLAYFTGLAVADPFTAAKGLFDGWAGKFRLVATGVFVLVLVISGIVYSAGGRELKGAAKKKMGDTIIGVIVVSGGAMFVAWLLAFVQQNGLN